MIAPLHLIIPGQPAPKERPRVANGHAFTSSKTRAAEEQITWLAKAARFAPLAGPVSFTARFYVGDLRRRDLDNMAKLVTDALNGIAYADDSQIALMNLSRGYDFGNPRTEVVIAQLDIQIPARPKAKRKVA